MLTGRLGVFLTIYALAHLAPRCEAQKQGFIWTFGDNFILTDLQECQNLSIVVSALPSTPSSLGTPPYYMLALELGGVPTTTMVGTDPSKLSWQANHARGSSLMLTMVDSTGSTGGIPPNLFNMTAGNSTCLPTNPPSSSLASIRPNVTTSLTTCQPWGLTITNGTKPYQILLSAKDSPVITNVTMGADDDVFTFIDRADSGTLLMASVVDATGQWGVSSNVVPTTGSKNYDCIGLVSSSKTTQEIQQEAIDQAAAAAAAARHRRNVRILAIVLGVCIPILLLTAAATFWWHRRRKLRLDRDRGVWDGQDVSARVWELPPGTGEMVEVNGNSEVQQRLLDHKRSMSVINSSSAPGTPGSIPLQFLAPSPTADQSSGWDGVGSSGPSRSHSQSDSTRATITSDTSPQQRKALEARGLSSVGSSSRLPPGAQAPALPGGRSPGPRVMDVADTLETEVGPDIIIQHRDGGAGTVQELPPPYMNRMARTSQPS